MTNKPDNLADLWVADRDRQNAAYHAALSVATGPVSWAYDVWDVALENLQHKDNHNRAIATQVLCALAQSDVEGRMAKALPKVVEVTKDERFVTARHTMQALWKVGVVSPALRKSLLAALHTRFEACAAEKNCTLIRYDIAECLRKIFDATQDANVKESALAWIATEPDEKYRKKYMTLWKKV